LPISAVDAINPAFRHAKRQLLQPFRFTQWARLALVGLLSGEIGSGGGCNTGSSFRWPAPPPAKGSGGVIHATLGSQLWHAAPHTHVAGGTQIARHPLPHAGLLALLIMAGLGFVVLFIYIASVMRFVLFDSVIAKECHIRQGWARHRHHGLRLFGWQMLLMLGTFASIAGVIAIPVASAWALGWFAHPREHVLGLVLAGGLFLMLFFPLLLGLGVVHVMTKDFVVPQMALENVSVMEGWRRLWSWVAAEKLSYVGYIGMKILLAIGAGVVSGIFTLIILLMLFIPIGGIGAIAVIAGAAAGWTWNLMTIALAVLAGFVAFALIMFVVSFISVPATVFFPAYSIYFLGLRYPRLATLLGPPPAAAVAAEPWTPDAPPLPPTPAPLG